MPIAESNKHKLKIEGVDISSRGIGAITLWVALFWGDPDIADAIIKFLMNAHQVCK